MTDILSIINFAMVFIYGLVLTAAFSGTLYNRRYRNGLMIFYLLIFIVQITLFFMFGPKVVEMIYPLVTHLPLLLFLVYFCKKTWSTAIISLVSAYLMTSPRHWIGSVGAALFGGSIDAFYLTQILLTIPMLFLLVRFVAPFLRSVLIESGRGPWLFSAFLIMYYFSTYAMTVYSDAMYSGDPAVVEFVNSSIVIYYFAFILLYYREVQSRTRAENDLKILEIKSQQAKVYIEQIKQSHKQVAVFRHDLRHHLECIKAYLGDNKTQEALEYMQSIIKGIESTVITEYCANETVNMLLSSYVEKARVSGITCKVEAAAVQNDLSIPPVDLCVIIANAMENAIYACSSLPDAGKSYITINAHSKNDLFFFEIMNPYHGEIRFEDGIPVTDAIEHGVGTRSIVMATEKHNGLWSFNAENGKFTMRVALSDMP